MHEIVTGHLTLLPGLAATLCGRGVERIVVIQDEHVVLSLRLFTLIA